MFYTIQPLSWENQKYHTHHLGFVNSFSLL